MNVLASLRRSTSGAVSAIVMIVLPVMVGIAGFALEYGNGLLTKVSNQRVADAAAFAGAVAFGKTQNPASIGPAVLRVGAFAGLPASAIAYSSGLSPRSNGNTAIQVVVTTAVPLYFSRLVNARASIAVVAASSAEITADVPGCIFALAAGGAGFTLSGGTSVLASGCSAASNSVLVGPCGTSIKAKSLSYNSATAPVQPCGAFKTPEGNPAPIIRKAVVDPVLDNLAVRAAAARIAGVAAMTEPGVPAAVTIAEPGLPIDFGYSTAVTQAQAVLLGCTASWSSPTWTLVCPPGTTRVFSAMTQGGGIRVRFVPDGTGGNIYKFKQAVLANGNGYEFGKGTYIFGGDFRSSGGGKNSFAGGNIHLNGDLVNGSSGGITFGNGDFTVRKGIVNDSSGAMVFGAGNFLIGDSSIQCGSGYYSICTRNGPISFTGSSTADSNFFLSSGLFVTGGTSVRLGTEAARNSFRLGKSSNGNSITGLGASSTFFGDVKPGTGLFEMSGKLDFAGGSCLSMPAAANHDINSSFDTAGGVIFGKGVYTFNGYLAFGRAGGGAGNCDGVAVTVKGTDVTFVVSGINPLATGSCGASSFCIAAGYSGVSLQAPLTGALARILVIGPQASSNITGARFGEGGANVSLSGLFYYPFGPITLGGGAGVGDKDGQCLTLIGSEVAMTGGTVVATSCLSGAVGNGPVVLVR